MLRKRSTYDHHKAHKKQRQTFFSIKQSWSGNQGSCPPTRQQKRIGHVHIYFIYFSFFHYYSQGAMPGILFPFILFYFAAGIHFPDSFSMHFYPSFYYPFFHYYSQGAMPGILFPFILFYFATGIHFPDRFSMHFYPSFFIFHLSR